MFCFSNNFCMCFCISHEADVLEVTVDEEGDDDDSDDEEQFFIY